MPTHTVYKPADRPQCEVLVDGRWVPGEVRMWTQDDNDSWTANVQYQPARGENRLDNFPAERLRPVDEGSAPHKGDRA